MRKLDYILQAWRYRKVEPHIPAHCKILDIGAFDGSFLRRLEDRIAEGVAIDPLLEETKTDKITFRRIKASGKLPFPDASFDVVTMLAVYEHLGAEREAVTAEVFRVLSNKGLALLTVPSNKVDYILAVLLKLRLIDGQSLEEHDHFDGAKTRDVFEHQGFTLRHWSRFQLGLNNFFIFEKEGRNV